MEKDNAPDIYFSTCLIDSNSQTVLELDKRISFLFRDN